MTDTLIIIAICVGLACLIAVIAVGLKVKNSSAGQNEKKLDEVSRSLIRLEAASGENSRLIQAQEARIADLKNKMDADLRYISQTTAEGVEKIRLSVEEKLSLVKRFGLTLYYPSPNQKEYLNIVRSLAEREGITPDAELESAALVWQRREGGMSGRTAEQFLISEKQKG